MKTTLKLPKLIIAVVALTVAVSTHAATITWGAPQDVTGDSDVSTTPGTVVAAFNFGPVGVPGTTVNTVTFESFSIPLGSPSVTVGNFTLASAADNGIRGTTFVISEQPFASLSASYQTLLASFGFPRLPNFTMTLTMAGLTAGQSYEFQWWANQSSGGTGTTSATAGNTVTLNENPTTVRGGLGQFAIGTFIADATESQLITFTPNSASQPFVNGFQLRTVPEPSTWVMLAGGAGSLLGFRRRR